MWRVIFWISSFIVFALIFSGYYFLAPAIAWLFYLVLPLFLVGIYDVFQKKSNILRNYPLVGHIRYILLGIRPEINQYFIENDQNGLPFSTEQRNLVYRRASRNRLSVIPFGTQREVYAEGYEWLSHSVHPVILDPSEARIMIGGAKCRQPYSASRLNISALSYGAISKNAVRALNLGAKLGNFYHNTGEGGISSYHLEYGGDLVFQFGTGYFGCRDLQGRFDPELFAKKSRIPEVKMIEVKLSQGAKPSYGGLLPAIKVTPEIAAMRGVQEYEDCISPHAHTAFVTPRELLIFLDQLRSLSGGKPVGFKLCVGSRREFLSICKAMVETGLLPDFITVDGGEGGTGAAPVEFTNSIGEPLEDGLSFVNNCLLGIGVRDKIRLICSGKILTGFQMVAKLALGADICNSARGMMFALGCVQSRSCNTNRCPTGVTSLDPKREYAIDVDLKGQWVANFHATSIKSFLEVLGASGVSRVAEFEPHYILRRIDPLKVLSYEKIYPRLRPGSLLDGTASAEYLSVWNKASADQFKR